MWILALSASINLRTNDASISFGADMKVRLYLQNNELQLNSNLMFTDPTNNLTTSLYALVSQLRELQTQVSSTDNGSVPSLTGRVNTTTLQNYLNNRRTQIMNIAAWSYVVSTPQPAIVLPELSAYYGGVYSPTDNRIYLVPCMQADGSDWHYIDCDTGTMVAYPHNLVYGAVNMAYVGGVYAPLQNRVYFVPYKQADVANFIWHYVDCTNLLVIEYTHTLETLPTSAAYFGGVYSPNEDKIYFVPSAQAPFDRWHLIECQSGTIVSYEHNLSLPATNNAYDGGVYSPKDDRIYFVPYLQIDELHFIECNNGSVGVLHHNMTTFVGNGAYAGGVYSPTTNRVYFSPYTQSSSSIWHYIDTENQAVVVEYDHTLTTSPVPTAYVGGAYSPSNDRIYFAPYDQHGRDGTYWHYVDCYSGAVVEYSHTLTNVANGCAFCGGVYSPTNNRVYFIPHNTSYPTSVHISDMSSVTYPRGLFAHSMFNGY